MPTRRATSGDFSIEPRRAVITRPFAKDDNPAAGQILYRTREKRARRVLGFKAFSIDQIRILFSREALEGLSEAAQWGAWIGLYTGARVAEVGQLALADFIMEEGIPCIRITNEGAGQSVKNDASLRTIPVHPVLISMGLLDRVAMLKASGETRLFPKVKVDGVNGAGNWLSKAFTLHVEKNLALPEKGKIGFHSLRKSVVQGLQTAGVSSEHRAAYVGHELGDEHYGTYSRRPRMVELLVEVAKMGAGHVRNQLCTEPGFHEVARKQCLADGHAVYQQTRDFKDGLFVRHWLVPGHCPL